MFARQKIIRPSRKLEKDVAYRVGNWKPNVHHKPVVFYAKWDINCLKNQQLSTLIPNKIPVSPRRSTVNAQEIVS